MTVAKSRRRTAATRAKHKYLALPLLALTQLMVVLDLSIVTVALPSIRQNLGFSTTGLQWVITGYALVFGGFLLIGGRAGDLFGRRRVFLVGLASFGAASLLGGLAITPWMLVSARLLQGLGAAMLTPTALSLITSIFPDGRERDQALGVYSAMAALGFVTGTVSGGLLTETLGWRAVLFVNVPLALAALLATPALIPGSRGTKRDQPLDLLGAATVTLALAALIYALSEASSNGWSSPTTLGLAAGGVGLLAVFVVIERRSPEPLVPLSFFRMHTVTAANAVIMLKSTVGIADILVPTLYFQQVLAYSPLKSGLSFIPMGIAAAVAALVAGRVIGRLGRVRRVIALGLMVEAAGLLLMTRMPGSGPWPVLMVGMVLEVVGYLAADVALTIAATSGLGEDGRGLAAGILNTSQQLGAAWGTGVITTVIAARIGVLGGEHAGREALLSGLQYALLTGVGFVALALLIALVALRGEGTRRRID